MSALQYGILFSFFYRRKRKHDDQDTTAQRESSSDQHGDGRDVDVGATGASTSSAQEEPPQGIIDYAFT